MHLELIRDKGRAMPAIDLPESYESARIWHCSYATLAPLDALVNLRALAIATVPDTTLSFLPGCRQLEWLSLLHLPRITDLSPLAALPQLRCLELATLPSWDASGKRTVVDSLEPIIGLPGLEHLSLMGIAGPDRSLAPLERCRSLKTARFQGVLLKEKARFFAATGLGTRHMPGPGLPSWPAWPPEQNP
jgi:hypothetical protein